MTPDIRPGIGGLLDILPGVLTTVAGPAAGFEDRLGLADDLAGIRRVAVLLVDGFGYQLMSAAAAVGPTLDDISQGRLGSARPLHCGFPSTTPVSLVGIGTGRPPGAHGIVGFAARVPETGRVLNHIRWGDDPSAAVYQPVPTVFERAAAAGVNTVVVSKPEFEGSGLTRSAYRGSEFRGATDRYALISTVVGALNDSVPLVYGYHADLDHFGHGYGVGSPEWLDAARGVDRAVGCSNGGNAQLAGFKAAPLIRYGSPDSAAARSGDGSPAEPAARQAAARCARRAAKAPTLAAALSSSANTRRSARPSLPCTVHGNGRSMPSIYSAARAPGGNDGPSRSAARHLRATIMSSSPSP